MKLRTLGLILGCVIGATVGYAKAAEPVAVSEPEMIVLSPVECEQVAIETMLRVAEKQLGYPMSRNGQDLTANAKIVADVIEASNPELVNSDPGVVAQYLVEACSDARGITDIPVTH